MPTTRLLTVFNSSLRRIVVTSAPSTLRTVMGTAITISLVLPYVPFETVTVFTMPG